MIGLPLTSWSPMTMVKSPIPRASFSLYGAVNQIFRGLIAILGVLAVLDIIGLLGFIDLDDMIGMIVWILWSLFLLEIGVLGLTTKEA